METPLALHTGSASRYRWIVLAAGTFAQAGYASIIFGLAVLAPALRARYDLTLPEVGVVLAAPGLGSIATFYAWGHATDRVGERFVLGAGLGAASLCLVAAAFTSSFEALVLLMALAGALGASVNASSVRAVMHWFDPGGRGLALGVRQAAIPIAGAWVALVIPAITAGDDPRLALLTLAAFCGLGAVIGLIVLQKDSGAPGTSGTPSGPAPRRDRRVWLVSGASALLVQPQVCLVGFLVLFLHDERGLSTSVAAGVLALLNVFGIGARIGVGHWSDILGSRVRPLRMIALASAALVAICTVLVAAPLGLLLPALVLMGCVAMSWNGLAFAATAETVGYERSGAATGIQQTVVGISGSLLPIVFGALVAASSWRAGFAVSALFPVAGWWVLRALPG